jgi:hypothetical protein
MKFFTETEKNSKIHIESQKAHTAKANMSQKNKTRHIILSDLKIYHSLGMVAYTRKSSS